MKAVSEYKSMLDEYSGGGRRKVCVHFHVDSNARRVRMFYLAKDPGRNPVEFCDSEEMDSVSYGEELEGVAPCDYDDEKRRLTRKAVIGMMSQVAKAQKLYAKRAVPVKRLVRKDDGTTVIEEVPGVSISITPPIVAIR